MRAPYLAENRWLRFGAFTGFYFAQGVPIGLLGIAIPAWLAEQGLTLAQIAVYQGIVSLPWGFKLVAGPFMDRFAFPAMGRRRPWVMAAQGGLTMALASLIAVEDPAGQLSLVIALGFAINCFSATQDVAVDGMAIDVLPVDERGRANAFMAFGQVAGFSSFAAISGVLLSRFGLWAAALAAALTVALIFALITFTRERRGEKVLPWTAGAPAPRSVAVEASFRGVFGGLWRALFMPMCLVLMGCEFLIRLRDGVALAVVPVFAVQDLGYSSAAYSSAQGALGLSVAVLGLGFGPVIDRFGAKRLFMFGIGASAVVTLIFAGTTQLWPDTRYVVAMWFAMSLSGQILFVSFIALAMTLCWAPVAASQFAIYMSLSNLSRSLGAWAFAFVAASVSYPQAFLLIGGLLVGALVALSFFDLQSHLRRLESMDSDPLRQQPPPAAELDRSGA